MKKFNPQDCEHWIFDMDGALTISAHDFEFILREPGLPDQVLIREALRAMRLINN